MKLFFAVLAWLYGAGLPDLGDHNDPSGIQLNGNVTPIAHAPPAPSPERPRPR